MGAAGDARGTHEGAGRLHAAASRSTVRDLGRAFSTAGTASVGEKKKEIERDKINGEERGGAEKRER